LSININKQDELESFIKIFAENCKLLEVCANEIKCLIAEINKEEVKNKKLVMSEDC